MCVKGWTLPRYNPANISITTIELGHDPTPLDIRGGPASAEHVSILGSSKLNELVLRVAAGNGHNLTSQISSDILRIADNIAIPG